MRIVPPLPTTPLVPRGVYMAPYLSRRGYPVLVAVDRRNRWIDYRILRPDVDEREADRFLWRRLDTADPMPRLRLVRDAGAHAASQTTVMSPATFCRLLRRA